ncbi:hypothetical protein [Jannaschia sp. M317]|uniref:hypothetical protein n=1 Tax=Jannaschia sp. M317 TaxID=2867011 RepID=UPI0021A2DC55|nr:hypothetical protein [Jannaschia sp. M317]UWQ17683.1 hypothetical protein K3551_17710 [Jannaschia sp. M317]
MTHAHMAPLMGLGMGAMVPLMVHGPWAGAGLAFVLAHIGALLGLAAAALLLPGLRARLARHRPLTAMPRPMAVAAVTGFALICTHCLVTLHGTL